MRAQIYSGQGNTTPRSKIVTKLSGTTGVSWKQRSYAPTSMPGLGKYAEALKEYDYLISLHLRNVTLARALRDRAWFRATCQNASFRSGQQAVKDAKAACSIMRWKDEHMIDTLAVAYAETGDLNSAVHYAAQALAVKGIPSASTKLFQQHLASFQQCKPIRS